MLMCAPYHPLMLNVAPAPAADPVAGGAASGQNALTVVPGELLIYLLRHAGLVRKLAYRARLWLAPNWSMAGILIVIPSMLRHTVLTAACLRQSACSS